jgi:hypothetical protein
MALNNIENQIKEKLNAREIQPSAPAWDRLDAMLSVAETKKPKRDFTWLYLAAAFLLFCGLGFFLLNFNETVAIKNTFPVVTNETTNEKIEENHTQKETVFETFEENKVVAKTEKQSPAQATTIVIIEEALSPITQHPSPNNYKYLSPEALLAQIEQPNKNDSSKIKFNPSNKIQIDAHELLTKAEQEVHQKHKESTIDKLRRNFNEVKSAVANRNYE